LTLLPLYAGLPSPH
ncbi:cobQ/CobB/MinD/ParA nucleotide binding domain protein, partial [Chlamydia psittaci 03DC29]